jgi:proline iminopeptidase
MRIWVMAVVLSCAVGCKQKECPPAAVVAAPAAPAPVAAAPSKYLDSSGRDDAWSGGSRFIPIKTAKGTFNVWVKRTGNNPTIKVLLLHGGPGATHEYFEVFDSFFPKAEIEYYFYDQLESGNSDRPDKPELWEPERFADEVEQVRQALKLDKSNFYLLGHSWGGIVAMEYALKYQDNLKGLIISNMMSSAPAYSKYATDVLIPQMDPKVLAEVRKLEAAKKYDDPRYEELLFGSYYVEHILRVPPEKWPDGLVRAFAKLNKKLYIALQGPSEMGLSGRLEKWDRTPDLPKITVPTLVIAGKFDTMDPAFMEKMSKAVKHGRLLMCPKGSHLAMYDDQETYFTGLIAFLRDVDAGRF